MLPALAGSCASPSLKSNFMVQIGRPNEEGFLLRFSTLTAVLIDVWFSDQPRETAQRQIIQHEKCGAAQTKAGGSSARGGVIKSCMCAAHAATWKWVKVSVYSWRIEKVNFPARATQDKVEWLLVGLIKKKSTVLKLFLSGRWNFHVLFLWSS